jgi:hemoglobin
MFEDVFDLIGGRSTIEAAIELFYDKVLHDDGLSPYFEQVDMATFGLDRLCSFPCS